jgi:exopolyphosphatase/pppGpp-phosphohydrolase
MSRSSKNLQLVNEKTLLGTIVSKGELFKQINKNIENAMRLNAYMHKWCDDTVDFKSLAATSALREGENAADFVHSVYEIMEFVVVVVEYETQLKHCIINT